GSPPSPSRSFPSPLRPPSRWPAMPAGRGPATIRQRSLSYPVARTGYDIDKIWSSQEPARKPAASRDFSVALPAGADHIQRIHTESRGTVGRETTGFIQSSGNRFIWPALLRDRAVTARLVLVYENVAVPVLPVEAGGLEVGENEGADADVPLPDHRPPEMHAAGVPAGRRPPGPAPPDL